MAQLSKTICNLASEVVIVYILFKIGYPLDVIIIMSYPRMVEVWFVLTTDAVIHNLRRYTSNIVTLKFENNEKIHQRAILLLYEQRGTSMLCCQACGPRAL